MTNERAGERASAGEDPTLLGHRTITADAVAIRRNPASRVDQKNGRYSKVGMLRNKYVPNLHARIRPSLLQLSKESAGRRSITPDAGLPGERHSMISFWDGTQSSFTLIASTCKSPNWSSVWMPETLLCFGQPFARFTW